MKKLKSQEVGALQKPLKTPEEKLLIELEKLGVSARYNTCCPERHTLTLVFPTGWELEVHAEGSNGFLGVLRVV